MVSPMLAALSKPGLGGTGVLAANMIRLISSAPATYTIVRPAAIKLP